MFATTHTGSARWVVANANAKRSAWINAILHVPPALPYDGKDPEVAAAPTRRHGGATRPGRAQPSPGACRAPMTTVQRPTTPRWRDGGGRPLEVAPWPADAAELPAAWLPRGLVAGLVLGAAGPGRHGLRGDPRGAFIGTARPSCR